MGVRREGGRLVFHQCVERDWGCCCSGWIGRVGEGRWVVVEVVDIFYFILVVLGVGWSVGGGMARWRRRCLSGLGCLRRREQRKRWAGMLCGESGVKMMLSLKTRFSGPNWDLCSP